jgi:hypothetical protein
MQQGIYIGVIYASTVKMIDALDQLTPATLRRLNMPPLRFKKGDKVYAVNPREKVFKATIKATHPKTQPDLPYELDLATSMRHYPENGVFATRQEAEQQLAKDNLVKVEKALDQHGAMKMVQAVVPNEDGSYTGTGGEIIRPDFELSDKDLEEANRLQ